MPILNQAKKAIRRDEKRRMYNLRAKRATKEAVKTVRDLAAAGKSKEAEAKLPAAYKAIDKAAKRGVLDKNTAARKKSRLTKSLAEK